MIKKISQYYWNFKANVFKRRLRRTIWLQPRDEDLIKTNQDEILEALKIDDPGPYKYNVTSAMDEGRVYIIDNKNKLHKVTINRGEENDSTST